VKGDGQEDGCCWAAYLQFTVKEIIEQVLYLMVKDAYDSFQKPFFRGSCRLSLLTDLEMQTHFRTLGRLLQTLQFYTT
jgi:hypothetical protein